MSQDTTDLEDTAWTVEEIGQNLDMLYRNQPNPKMFQYNPKDFV